jgi:ubiquinone/menaquinone biosynthesis C-methylase UbiE
VTRSDAARPVRFYVAAVLLCIVAFYAGSRSVTRPPARRVHPLTGRQIAGLATDAGWMDRAARQGEEAPDRMLALVGLRSGMAVADVGAGSGYVTTRLARLVAPGGTVYATDLQPDLLRIIRQKVQAEQLANVEIVQGTDVDAHLPENGVDLVLLVDVYHEFLHPQEMLHSLDRALRADGRLVLVEYRKEDSSIPIAVTHRMSVADARTEVEAEHFRFERVIEELPRQHIIVFRKDRRADCPPTGWQVCFHDILEGPSISRTTH